MSDNPDIGTFDRSTPEGKANLINMARFQSASTEFSEHATELMAASVRMQILVLDDARLILAEIADGLSVAVRNQRTANKTHG